MLETPITASNVSRNGCKIYYKRDDLIPFSLGGNKARIVYEYLKDMKEKGCDTIVGYGNDKSNLCRVIAAAAARGAAARESLAEKGGTDALNVCSGGGAIIYSYATETEMANSRSFNSALINASKVKIIKCLKSDVAQTVDSVLSEIAKNGGKPYYVYGDKYGQGNEKTAVKAYYNAFFDILAQCEEQRLSFDYIFLATGTGMTQSGLLAGLYESRLFLSQKVIGISVARSGVQAKDVIRRNCSLFFGIDFPEELVYVDDTHLAGGYGKYGLPVEDAISEAWQKDGVPLDTCYTGKAFCGMLDFIIKNNIREKSILFLHTGGLPIFFDYIREKKQ